MTSIELIIFWQNSNIQIGYWRPLHQNAHCRKGEGDIWDIFIKNHSKSLILSASWLDFYLEWIRSHVGGARLVDILKWDQYDNSFNSFCATRDVRIMMSVSVKVDWTLGVFLALICCEIVLVESTCHVVHDNGTAVRPKVRPLSATKMKVKSYPLPIHW